MLRIVRRMSQPATQPIYNQDIEIFYRHFNKHTVHTNPGGICRDCYGSGWISLNKDRREIENKNDNDNDKKTIFNNLLNIEICKRCNGTGLY